LLPTKPIVAFIGPKGSGKTMAQRILLKVLFGPKFDVTSPDLDKCEKKHIIENNSQKKRINHIP
jgi:ABC-type multidrug transport system ATPase subunit